MYPLKVIFRETRSLCFSGFPSSSSVAFDLIRQDLAWVFHSCAQVISFSFFSVSDKYDCQGRCIAPTVVDEIHNDDRTKQIHFNSCTKYPASCGIWFLFKENPSYSREWCVCLSVCMCLCVLMMTTVGGQFPSSTNTFPLKALSADLLVELASCGSLQWIKLNTLLRILNSVLNFNFCYKNISSPSRLSPLLPTQLLLINLVFIKKKETVILVIST